MIDKKSKIFFTVLAFIALVSVATTYYRYVLLKDFDIFTDEIIFYEYLEE